VATNTSIAQVSYSPQLEQLGKCPVCDESVVANAYAVRYREAWYHIRCALSHENGSSAEGLRSTGSPSS